VLALMWAASYAEAVGATVDAVSAWHTSTEWGFAGVPLNWDPQEVAGNVLDAAIIEAFGHDAPHWLIRSVREGRASQVLLDAAKDADMVMVGSRGHGGFVGMLLGSVSAALAEHSSCPVLVVHGDRPPLPLARA
jgi:nucleotide-binding universal stress UspA family protein